MTAGTDKIKGIANVAIGSAKEGLGKVAGNPNVEAEGVVQKAKGHIQEAVGDAKAAVKKVVDKA